MGRRIIMTQLTGHHGMTQIEQSAEIGVRWQASNEANAVTVRFESPQIGSGAAGADKAFFSTAQFKLKEMSDATVIMAAIEEGDHRATEQLLVLVYDELRRLA